MNARITRAGIGARTVIGATAALAVALFAGGLILRSLLNNSLYASIGDQALTRANGVAALVATGDYNTVIQAEGRTPGWVQVVDADGTVIAATANVAQLRKPFASIPVDRRPMVRRLAGLPIDTGEPVAVAIVPSRGESQHLTVLAAAPLDLAETANNRIVRSLLLVFPALLALTALVVWAVVRRALRPVEAIRRQVATISTTDLNRRVPVPPTNDEIGRLATTMNDMLERLNRSVERQRRFVADASHELRSPLASLRNQLEVSTIDNPDPAWAADVRDMIIDHDRLERLLQDLLLLARHDALDNPVLEPLDLGYVVRRELARRPQVAGIDRIVDADNIIVNAHDDSVARIVRNLLDNAERHAHRRIQVSVHPSSIGAASANWAELAIEDDGPGIPVESHRHVFERFTRLDDAREADAGGSGLGLAIVADLVENHGGTVGVDPLSPGTRIVVRLPILPA